MLVFGLTGGIASGKSTVARLFCTLGVPVVDADALYHRLIAPVAGAASPLAQAIAKALALPLGPDHHLDRKSLGTKIFADSGAKATLEAISHPAVNASAEQQFARLAHKGHHHALYDVPLLYERNLSSRFAGVAVVWVPNTVQVARLIARDGHDPKVAAVRLAAQLPLDDKRRRARWVIDNQFDIDTTKKQVMAVAQDMDAWPNLAL